MKNEAAIDLKGGAHGILLLHGLSSSPREVAYLAREWHRAGFTVYAPIIDQYSLDPASPDASAWIRGACAAFDALSARCTHVSISGLSMGATLALAVAHERPAAVAVATLSVTLTYDGWAIPWYHFLLDWIYYTPLRHRWRYHEQPPFGLKNEALRMRVARAMTRETFSDIGPSSIALPAIHEASRLARQVRRMLPQITMPCLVIHAIDDETAGPRNAFEVISRISSETVRAIYLDNSYHMISCDNDRETVAREVVTFLRERESLLHTDDSQRPANRAAPLSRQLTRHRRTQHRRIQSASS